MILLDGSAFRGDDSAYPDYRTYEIAGAPHIPDTAEVRRDLPFVEDTTPLDWTVVLRAVFGAGSRWARKVTEPPPSSALVNDDTGIARDENLNALGGIRLPDLMLGRGRFIAVDFEGFPDFPLVGGFVDLQCEPLPDGSPRFPDHLHYVRELIEATLTLVKQRLLLPGDAIALIGKAVASDVGRPGTCEQR